MYNKPLAYFITFTTYGTWLHGDVRKSIIVENHTTKLLEPKESLYQSEQQQLKHPVVLLDRVMRQAVCDAIVEHCLWKDWRLFTAHVRSNHVHLLVASDKPIEKVMSSLKAWATRKLRQSGFDLPTVWTRHGSTQLVFEKATLVEKIRYTVHEQGDMMAYYVAPGFE